MVNSTLQIPCSLTPTGQMVTLIQSQTGTLLLWISGLSLMAKLWFLIIRYFLKRLNRNYLEFKSRLGKLQKLPSRREQKKPQNTHRGKGTHASMFTETVPSTVQYLPICCPPARLLWCPSRNISKKRRKRSEQKLWKQNSGDWFSLFSSAQLETHTKNK